MSILIGYVKDGVVYMATDTRIINGNRKINQTCKSNYKIQKLDNGIIYGVVDNTMARQILMANDDIFTLNEKNDLTHKHLVTVIVPKIYKLMKDNNMLNNEKDELPRIRNFSMFIGFKDKLFEVCRNFEVFHYEKYQSVGERSNYSQNKLANINSCEDIESQLVKAMQNCAERTEYVAGPYITINTKDMNYRVWEGK